MRRRLPQIGTSAEKGCWGLHNAGKRLKRSRTEVDDEQDDIGGKAIGPQLSSSLLLMITVEGTVLRPSYGAAT